MEKKKIFLMLRTLKRMGYPDADVAHKCLSGFPLVGDLDQTGVFETRPQEELIVGADPSWLARNAKRSR